MNYLSVLAVYLLILFVVETSAFNFKKVFNETTENIINIAKESEQKHRKKLEKYEDLAEKIKEKLGEKVNSILFIFYANPNAYMNFP